MGTWRAESSQRARAWVVGALVALAALGGTILRGHAAAQSAHPPLAQLPAAGPVNRDLAELGRHLFFDSRLSGDWALSCASCHDPAKGWADGEPLSKAYPASEYFRNAPTIINARYRVRFMWDGRLDGSDLGTLVRDMVTEAHFMNSDGRLVQERLKQVPEYVVMWEKAFGKGTEPYGPRMFNVAVVLESLAAVLRETDWQAEATHLEIRARLIRAKHAQLNPTR